MEADNAAAPRTAGRGGDPWSTWREELVGAGLLVATGLDGLWGRSQTFESIAEGVAVAVGRLGRDSDATVLRFPPLLPRHAFARTGYLRSFPDLIGSVHSFTGGDREHASLLAQQAAQQDWAAALSPTEVMLCSAACHPLYPTLAGPVPPGGGRWDVYGWVFRAEPSLDPARQQAFRQYEIVYVGEPDRATSHRDGWVETGGSMLRGLGLEVRSEVASDPFFGRAGRLLAGSQRDEQLKIELLAPTGPGPLTAIASANCHRGHFGEAFGIRTSTGGTAHSACVGFGVERVALALLWRHGLDPSGWPRAVRSYLWP
jgi:seryl-tRNA synthetase